MMKSVETNQLSGIGIDIAEIAPFRHSKASFFELVFTQREIERCRRSDDPPRAFAVAWAAKEAAVKAVGGAWNVVQCETVGNRIRPVAWRHTPTVASDWEIHWREAVGDRDTVTVVARAWRAEERA